MTKPGDVRMSGAGRFALPVIVALSGISAAREGGKTAQVVLASVWLATVLALAAMILLRRERARRVVRRSAVKLGFSMTAAGVGLGSRLTRFPFNVPSRDDFFERHEGRWRGQNGSLTSLGASPRGFASAYRVAAVEMPTSLPVLELVPRKNRHRGSDVGRDIEFESSEFNDRWRVMCTDLVYAHAVVHPRLMERLLAEGPQAPPVTIEGRTIFLWRHRPHLQRHDSRRDLDFLIDVAGSIPPHVWRRYGNVPLAAREGSVPSGSGASLTTAPSRDKNRLGRLAVMLPFTFYGAPFAVVLGHRALRAAARGEASNRKMAIAGIVLGYFMTALTITVICCAIWYD